MWCTVLCTHLSVCVSVWVVDSIGGADPKPEAVTL